MLRKWAIPTVSLFLAGSLNAGIIGSPTLWDAGDGSVVCSSATWNHVDSEWIVAGKQCAKPGDLVGTFTTDTPDDPTVKIVNSIDNDMSFSWTDFQVDLTMNSTFTISDPIVTPPPVGWSATITQPVLVGSNYVGHILYNGGTPVANGDTLDFSYKMTFAGSTSYNYNQTMIPIPEPATMAGLLGLGGLGLLRRRRQA